MSTPTLAHFLGLANAATAADALALNAWGCRLLNAAALAALTNLKVLNIANNALHQARPLHKLVRLEQLYAQDNRFEVRCRLLLPQLAAAVIRLQPSRAHA